MYAVIWLDNDAVMRVTCINHMITRAFAAITWLTFGHFINSVIFISLIKTLKY
jgi:hypothetical protein